MVGKLKRLNIKQKQHRQKVWMLILDKMKGPINKKKN